ncbi:MAG TPA: dephospho-CoA kinase [Chthonomonadaceae bacterium]|nr:dephospho-CoA kinase [Chthonomonadaceae bacterium]
MIGVTGGIATGKSAVTRMLANRGAVTFSADEAARAVLTPRSKVLAAVAAEFGPEAIAADGSLDREAVGERIFADAASRERLNRITHPAILRLLRAQIEGAQYDLAPGTMVAVEVPLLYEANLSDWFELIVVVAASEPTQIARLMARGAPDEAQARRRLQAQLPIREKVRLADYVIWNDGSPDDLDTAVTRLWDELLRTGPPPGPIP